MLHHIIQQKNLTQMPWLIESRLDFRADACHSVLAKL